MIAHNYVGYQRLWRPVYFCPVLAGREAVFASWIASGKTSSISSGPLNLRASSSQPHTSLGVEHEMGENSPSGSEQQ